MIEEGNKYNLSEPLEINVKIGQVNDEERIYQIFFYSEELYGISVFIYREFAKEKIKELHFDRGALVEWLEDNLLNGEIKN